MGVARNVTVGYGNATTARNRVESVFRKCTYKSPDLLGPGNRNVRSAWPPRPTAYGSLLPPLTSQAPESGTACDRFPFRKRTLNVNLQVTEHCSRSRFNRGLTSLRRMLEGSRSTIRTFNARSLTKSARPQDMPLVFIFTTALIVLARGSKLESI